MIVLVANEKGGTGKSVLAVNLAVIRALAGRRILLFDTDRQGSAFLWAALREQAGLLPRVEAVQEFGASVRHSVLREENAFDDIFIDAGGRDSVELRASLTVCDFVAIPFRPSQFDVWGLERMTGLINEAREVNRRLDHLAVINLASPHPGVSEVDDARGYLSDLVGLKSAATVIRDRIAVRRSVRMGLGVVEIRPEDPKASVEMTSFYNEVFGG
jgi:chromosome partitioning protein